MIARSAKSLLERKERDWRSLGWSLCSFLRFLKAKSRTDLWLRPLPDKLKPSSLKERSEKKEDIKDGIPIDAQDIPYDPAKPDDHITGNPPSRRNTGGSRRSTKEPHCIPFYELPPRYVKILKSICPHCCLLGNILWRNVQQVQSRYESRFRPWKSKDETRACFLQCKNKVPILSWSVQTAHWT